MHVSYTRSIKVSHIMKVFEENEFWIQTREEAKEEKAKLFLFSENFSFITLLIPVSHSYCTS